MMQKPLLISDVITYAAEVNGTKEIVTSTVDGQRHRYTYKDALARISKLAHALIALGIKPGDRVGPLDWKTHRHFEIYYAVSGIGAVCHTINPRLPVQQVDFIIKHAEDALLLFDEDLAGLIGQLDLAGPHAPRLICLCSEERRPQAGTGPRAIAYETLLEGRPEAFTWPQFDENSASGLCYTSGTTGAPKGALYSHRSAVLHAMMTIVGRASAFASDGRILPIVPMFHVNAWSLPYSAPLAGQSLIMPGPKLDGDSLFRLMDEEGVVSTWGVPTVLQGLLNTMDRMKRKPNGLAEVVVGGSAASGQLIERFEDDFGVVVRHAWGMTEMSPVGSSGFLGSEADHLDRGSRTKLQLSQGKRLFGVEMNIIDEGGAALPKDGVHAGELVVRGNSVISGYFRNEEASAAAFDAAGWFRTGDRARISDGGRLTIVDRVKDLIKSGGEWISSADLEEAAMRFPGVLACAAIAVPDDKWGERPILVVRTETGAALDIEGLRALMARTLAKWQLPDRIIVRDALPMTATGKISKKDLRAEIAGATERR